MKNKDYNIDVEYELKIMSSSELKEKLMKDNNLTEEDIFLHYALNNLAEMRVSYTDLHNNTESTNKYLTLNDYSLLLHYQLYKRGIKLDKTVRMFNGYRDINQLCELKNIKEKPFKDSNNKTYYDFLEKHNLFYVERSIYTEVPYTDALLDIINYNLDIFNQHRVIADEKFKQCVENSYIVINETADGKYELIDGFYRILYKNVDCNVVVKVYKNITNEQWFKLMINCNYWKTNVNKSLFFDRGFILGLRCRYGINMEDYIFIKDRIFNTYNGLIDILSKNIDTIKINHHLEFTKALESKGLSPSNSVYITNDLNLFRNKVLLNKYFINDLKTIKSYLEYLPANILNLKKIKESDIFSNHAYQKFLSNILKLIFTYRVKYPDRKMNELPENLIDIIFEDKEIKDSFMKAVGLTVPGSIDNRLELLYPNLILIFNKVLLNEK